MITADKPQALGLDERRWQHALDLARGWCDDGTIPACAIVAGRSDRTTAVHGFGRQTLGSSSPLREDAIFLVASITKPIVATAVMLLVERGLITLSDRVCEYIPEFGGTGRYAIRIRHLLTHTSGLPDMLPDNRELRIRHAPLSEFVKRTCEADLAFTAGRNVQYQSKGFLLLGEIVHRITGRSCSDFLQSEVFAPLAMRDTALGAPESWFAGGSPTTDRIPEILTPPDMPSDADWGWNAKYWRTLGAPWGGLLTTPVDLARFAQMMLCYGASPGGRVVGRATIEAATRNQLYAFPDLPPELRISKPWGLGWRLNWPGYSANFGDLLSPMAYGHWGATGTILWMDPARNAFAVVLTTLPQEPQGKYLSRLSNAIAAAFE